ncbi:MAG: hypothetical protein GEV28_21360 [Actinophytocola sp.]|uniref:hypothetical protein n=1 Tax=Actinophytocola sp. TaxID=1872138 RepID=UPI001328F6EF|nr:hypothetical protein [Actinophytocola sp.]MPZ82808.1 hypothetical protein [Actinophytocola sp.]
MRAVVLAAVLLAGLASPAAALAQPQPAAPVVRCTMTDPRLAELSGLVADGDRWYAVNDGGTAVTVFVLTKDCAIEREIVGSVDPYDVEDLGRGPDGTFWLSDTGDNDLDRKTVALISLTADGAATLYRLTYPDGPHDTEAILVDRAGTPYLVTKSTLGTAGVYRPAAELASPGPTALEQVGTVRISATDTPGGPVPNIIGSVAITGGAMNADGTVLALRTYTDAYVYAVADGDVPAALTTAPVRVPLPGEAQGEAIAFEPDGTLVSASENTGQPIRAVPGAASLVAPPDPPEDTRAADKRPLGGTSGQSGGEDGLPALPAAAFTVVLVGGVFLFFRRRARRR